MSIKSFILAIAIASVSGSWDVASPDSGNVCAQVFLQPSFQGPSFLVKDSEQYSDLSDLQYYLRREQEDPQNVNTTAAAADPKWSFRVRSGCTLKLSNLPYLRGEVYEFSGDEQVFPLNPKSLGCECPKPCSCEAQKLRRSECGRAYLNNDCTNCKALFTPLQNTNYDETFKFPSKWSDDVKTILLKRGCEAVLEVVKPSGASQNVRFSSESSRVITSEVLENLGSITGYSCTCSSKDAVEENEQFSPNNENYPPLVNIPRTKGAINTLLFRDELKKHPGLLASLQSLRSRRSSKNAYILLLGLTGSGKSSAVNLLFDHPSITKVGDFVSTTSDILEFTIPVPVPELGLNNTALHVIDTPGIGDTRGYGQDAQFLATLEDFLNKHDDLKRRLPNVVLIFSKFSDNRFRGEGSSFVKMLRTIDLFKNKIIDKDTTNFIFVLTHYMSETKELTKDPRERIQSIREVIEEFSTLPRPINIVLAENKPEESELPSLNGFWQLPNGEFYPKNLFDQMQRNLINCEDPIGEAIIRTAFSNSDNFKISGKRYPLLRSSNSKVIKYLGTLASFTKPVSGTEVSTKLNEAYDLLEPELKRNYPDVLTTLQRTLFRKNILKINDLPRTSVDIMKLIEEIQINPLTLFLMEHVFNITIPEFQKDFVVGSGYSLVKDETLPAKIFEIGRGENIPSDIIYRVPDAYQILISHELDKNFQVFTDKDQFLGGRLKSLGLPEDVFPKSSYESSPLKHPGFNLISLEEEQAEGQQDIDWTSLTATVGYHTFQIRLTKNAKFSEEFEGVLTQLAPLNLTDEVNVGMWRHFFDIYGTHVVTHAFGGGSIQVYAEVVNESLALSNSEKFAVLSDTMGSIMQQLANDLIGKSSGYVPPEGVKYEFTQVGGSHRHYWSNFSEADETKNIDEWKESVKYEPVVLKSRMLLLPISDVVKEIKGDEEMRFMIEEASAKLLNASLIYMPVSRMDHQDHPESRDNLRGRIGKGDYESMQEFADMFNTISASGQEMQKQIFALIQDIERKKELDEQRFEERMRVLKEEEKERIRKELEEQRYQDEMAFRREQLENERLIKEKALTLELERQRLAAEAEQKLRMEQIRAQNHQVMIQFLNAESERNAQIAIAQMNKKEWWEKALDYVSNIFSTTSNSAAQALPAAAMMAG